MATYKREKDTMNKVTRVVTSKEALTKASNIRITSAKYSVNFMTL
jgi:hypothetical protein